MQHVIVLPDLGQTTNEAKVLTWHKTPGDKVSKGEALVEVETDKVDMDIESFVDGYLREILAPEGSLATALAPVAILTDRLDEPYTQPAAGNRLSQQAEEAPEPQVETAAGPPPAALAAVPAARMLAKKLGIDLSAIKGTGSGGLITRHDVEEFAAQSSEQGAAAPVSTDSRALAAMAAITTASKKNIPHFYMSRDVTVAAAEAWRRDWNRNHPDRKSSLNHLFVRAASQSLVDVPGMTIGLQDGVYQQRSGADILLIVATDKGLAHVPVSAPQDLRWEDYLQEMKKAVEEGPRRLTAQAAPSSRPALAVSNLGMFGVKEFSAIIPPGCTAALAVGAVRSEPIVSNNQVEIGRICTLTLSADHRVVDGVTAARFLERIAFHLNSL